MAAAIGKHAEQWDYYDCPSGCGTFQHRARTRKVRKVAEYEVTSFRDSSNALRTDHLARLLQRDNR